VRLPTVGRILTIVAASQIPEKTIFIHSAAVSRHIPQTLSLYFLADPSVVGAISHDVPLEDSSTSHASFRAIIYAHSYFTFRIDRDLLPTGILLRRLASE
jgi:hypothetical protein